MVRAAGATRPAAAAARSGQGRARRPRAAARSRARRARTRRVGRRRRAFERARACGRPVGRASETRTQYDRRRPTADPAAQLVELGEPEPVGALDDHHRRLGHVDADLDDGRADQHVERRRRGSGAISASRSAAFIRPWTSPTRSGARSSRSRLGLGLSRAADALDASSAVGLRRHRPSSTSGTTTNVRWPVGRLVPDAVATVRSSSAGRRIPVRIGIRPVGRRAQVGDVEIGVEDLAQRARDGRGGHQQDVRGGPPAFASSCAALLDPEAVLLVDHDQRRGRRTSTGLLEQRVRPDHDRRPGPIAIGLERRRGVASALQRAGQQRRRGCPSGSRRPPSVTACCRASRSVGASSAPCGPPARPRRAPTPRPRSCPSRRRPGAAAASASDAARSPRIAVDRGAPGRRSASTGVPEPRPRPRSASAASDRGRRRRPSIVDRRAPRSGRAARRRATMPELEREQLVEREPAQRGVAALEGRRVVGLPRAPRPIGTSALARRDAFAGRYSGIVRRRPGPAPRASRAAAERAVRPGGQPVDRHDAARVERARRRVRRLELGVVEGQQPAASLELAATRRSRRRRAAGAR